jgi:hypothetical protein
VVLDMLEQPPNNRAATTNRITTFFIESSPDL